MASAQDNQRMSEIRDRHNNASFDWHTSRDGEKLMATLIPKTRPVAIVTLTQDCGDEDRDFLMHAHADMAFLMRLLGEAFRTIRMQMQAAPSQPGRHHPSSAPTDKPKDFAAECAMKCADQAFRRYLMERHDLGDATDQIRVDTRVRAILAIQSRAELNTNPEAAARWKDLRADFDAWRNYP